MKKNTRISCDNALEMIKYEHVQPGLSDKCAEMEVTHVNDLYRSFSFMFSTV